MQNSRAAARKCENFYVNFLENTFFLYFDFTYVVVGRVVAALTKTHGSALWNIIIIIFVFFFLVFFFFANFQESV